MLINLTEEELKTIKNPVLRDYAQIYFRIEQGFQDWVQQTGLELDLDLRSKTEEILQKLQAKGAIFRNDGKSIVVNQISPACQACQKGIGSISLFISLRCHRHCFFCFNPNQDHYEEFLKEKRNYRKELDDLYHDGRKLTQLGLTGGEPLLHKAETLDFFQYARTKFPHAYTRLYTSGDLLDEEILRGLQESNLNEIRFSIKMEDPEELKDSILEKMKLARDYIPSVMVEMPVIPGTLEEMKKLVIKLDALGIFGINLLEFCFPLHNAEIFKEKGFKVKNPAYRVLYDYWYAGGLPVSQSEVECLELLEFILDQHLTLGAQYCSLENKHTAQIYQQNDHQRVTKALYFSAKDYFFKSAKVFGEDIPQVLSVFKKNRYTGYQINQDYDYLEFHVDQIKSLAKLDLEIGISYQVREKREDGSYLRELKLDLTTPKIFNPREDV
ncbi:radical SAM protein [Desulfitobacterium sp.]|uniref:radical SAM protein n=1 Tax=Desulfitobacterium sp. TaxID=49981 RepID=UPI002D1E03F9|nr:radical SAM protein [Desulfitobacterium sp.]HVJ49031.1 radical SAM protein [Desulfitobacterium sp.]